MSLGEKLYRLRTERGIYQKELAAELHMSISGISSYENDIHVPDIKTLEKWPDIFTYLQTICWAASNIWRPSTTWRKS